MSSQEIAQRVVAQLLEDLTGRRGFDNVWDDVYPETQDEMRAEWTAIVHSGLDDVSRSRPPDQLV